MKVTALTTVSSPYISARYTGFCNKFKHIKLDLIEISSVSSVYQWEPEKNVPSIYNRVILNLNNLSAEEENPLKLYQLIAKVLFQTDPDIVVICGYGVPGMLQALIWCILNNKVRVILSETKEDDCKRNWVKESFKSFIISQYQSALVGGYPHKRYLTKLGMPEDAIFVGYDVVGNDTFHPQKIRTLPVPVKRPFFLAINRFVGKKNLLFLLIAYSKYLQQFQDAAWDLVLCGDGELRSQIEQKISDLNLQDYVHLTGFLQQEQMLPYFAHAKCFIHASIQEQWGLVVNEAMASGLPVLVSNRCGCYEDLIVEGVNGFGFDPENLQQLTDLMLKISSDDVDLQKMGDRALEHIQNFSPDRFARGLMQAVEYSFVQH
jgi:glycosyltransferase involved in cell wall biosynthesis